MKIKQVAVETILPLRRDILRQGFTLDQSRFEGDLNPDSFHLALFDQDEILAIASYVFDLSDFSPVEKQYRLRGMAVAANQQNKGFGKAIFQEGERLLREKQIPYLWFNARTPAVDFYKKQNCRVLGEEFNIPTAGPHYYMYKNL
ncbi:MAG TPA: GNAT family N-acetyltransferase [Flavobacteriaceae bacterium]|nr:GNAT family N-acetyltransferase [Flavobacteriaceae bacterium]